MSKLSQLKTKAKKLKIEFAENVTEAELQKLVDAHGADAKAKAQAKAKVDAKTEDGMIATTALTLVQTGDGPVAAGDPVSLSKADYLALVNCGAVAPVPDLELD